MHDVASRWPPIAAYAALSASNQMLWLTFTPLTTDAARHYGVSSGAIGWLAEIFPLLYVVVSLPAGRLIDRDLPRWLAVGAGLTAAGAVVRILGGSYALALVGQVLVAVAQPLILNSVTAMSARYLREPDRPTGIAVSSAGIFAGILLALVTGGALGGDRITALLVVQAVLTVAASGWAVLALRAPGRASAASGPAARVRVVLTDRGLRALIGLACAGFGVFVALTTWLEALLEPAGVSSAQSTLLLLALVVAGVLGSAVVPPVLARRRAQLRFVLGAIMAGAVGLLVLAVAPGLDTGFPAATVLGFTLLTALPVILELTERRAGTAVGTATSMIWLAGNAAGLVAALIVQAVLHHPGVAFGLLAVLLAAAAPLIGVLRRTSATATPSARRTS